jgi:serine/threonine protein kinase
MRDLVRQIVEGYKSLKLEGQNEGYVQFSGQDPDTRQTVQIKILPRLLGEDPQIAARFRRLSQAIRQLNHPNIASTQAVGEKGGLPYVVTRAIERAQPLADKLNQPWAVDSAADTVMQVGQALEHAYNKGVVHGSLTPENVVVQDNGRVTVTDFGLADLLDLVGMQVRQAASPFLAPERVAGKPADARADVYSLAAILYALLTNRKPQIVQGQVLPPSRFNSDVPAAMDQVVVKALDPDPAVRYPTVKVFLAALGALALVPAQEEKAMPVTPGGRCPRCGAENQRGRFCRKCGTRLAREDAPASPPPPPAQSKLDEPIQITTVDVGQIEVGHGIEVQETTIAQPLAIAGEDLTVDFPKPLEMPQVDLQSLWPALSSGAAVVMPEPPPMPVIDWAEIAPPMPEVPSIEEIRIGEEDR